MLGFTLDECRDIGLVAAEEPQGNPLRVWTLFDFAHVRWDLVPRCLPTWCGMYIVVVMHTPAPTLDWPPPSLHTEGLQPSTPPPPLHTEAPTLDSTSTTAHEGAPTLDSPPPPSPHP